jgi:hypothetical protein
MPAGELREELLDSVYLYDKYGSPISHDAWMNVIRLVDWVATLIAGRPRTSHTDALRANGCQPVRT